MAKTAYENLEIYQLAVSLAEGVYQSVQEWRKFDRETLGRQIVRSADSIGANIAEGFGRGNTPDQKRFVRIARGSVYETKHWLKLAFARGFLSEEDVKQLKPTIDILPPKLNAYLRAIDRKR